MVFLVWASCCPAESPQQVPHENWINVDKNTGLCWHWWAERWDLGFRSHCCNITQTQRPTLSYLILWNFWTFWNFALSEDEWLHSVSSLFNGHWVPGWKKQHFPFGYQAEKVKPLWICKNSSVFMWNWCFWDDARQGFNGITKWVNLFVVVKYNYSCSVISTQTPLDHREIWIVVLLDTCVSFHEWLNVLDDNLLVS